MGSNPAGSYQYVGGSTVYTDPLGHIWTTTQDSDGNVTQAIDPLTATRTAGYTPQGLPNALPDAIGRSEALGYDSNGRLTAYQHLDGKIDTFTYDSYGNRTSHQDPEGRTTTYTYTPSPAQRLCASQVTPVPSTYTYGYTCQLSDYTGSSSFPMKAARSFS